MNVKKNESLGTFLATQPRTFTLGRTHKISQKSWVYNCGSSHPPRLQSCHSRCARFPRITQPARPPLRAPTFVSCISARIHPSSPISMLCLNQLQGQLLLRVFSLSFIRVTLFSAQFRPPLMLLPPNQGASPSTVFHVISQAASFLRTSSF